MRWSTCGLVRKHISPPPPLSSYSAKSAPGRYKCVQNTEVWGVVLFLFAWFCFGFDVFYSTTKEVRDKGIIRSMAWRSKRLMLRTWLVSLTSEDPPLHP